MERYLNMSTDDRRVYIEQAAAEHGLPDYIVEKDFWVCWTLKTLFGLHGIGEHLTFKGGTSLSKGWNLINRFSEDIDVVIDRGILGYREKGASPESAESKRQREKRLDGLMETCHQYVHETIRPSLEQAVGEALVTDARCELSWDETDPDDMTILFRYPSQLAYGGNIAPVVRIELGARSDIEPNELRHITPFLARILKEMQGVEIRIVSPERTFWEKALLLHEKNYGDSGERNIQRLSRHYYDLWQMIGHGIADKALADSALFDAVVEHRRIYFQRSASAQSAMQLGSLQIIPADDNFPKWETDYRSMKEMIVGEPPDFKTMIVDVGKFQHRCNNQ